MGRPLPGYAIALLDVLTGEAADEGEIALPLDRRPSALMTGYQDDDELNAEAMAGGYYHTGDVAPRDADGYVTYVGRSDDVFKASDYRISPFELESVLIEHPAVRRGRGRAGARPVAARGAEGVRRARGRDTRRAPRRPRRSCATPASTSRRTSASGGSNSPSCRRRSAARSAAWSCAAGGAGRSARPTEFREDDFPDLKRQ